MTEIYQSKKIPFISRFGADLKLLRKGDIPLAQSFWRYAVVVNLVFFAFLVISSPATTYLSKDVPNLPFVVQDVAFYIVFFCFLHYGQYGSCCIWSTNTK